MDIMNTIIEKQDGVTYYFKEGTCYNIDIEPWVTSVTFIEQPSSLYNKTWYELREILKQYPNVTTIVINQDIANINISNFMFPNVRNVISKSYRFKSGKYLIRNKTLYNSFCLSKEEILDINEFDDIYDYALEGCRSLITTARYGDEYLKYTNLGFDGSMFILKPLIGNRMRLIGGCAMNTITDSKILIMPDDEEEVYGIYIGNSRVNEKTLIVHRQETLDLLILQSRLALNALIIKADARANIMKRVLDMPNIKNIILDSHNPYCKIIDSVLYSKNGRVVYACARNTKGEVNIQDGTEVIESYAFYGCNNIETVMIPDSVKEIGVGAFKGCRNLQYVRLGKGIKKIRENCFYLCKNLQTVDCDGDIEYIGPTAFFGCRSLTQIFSLIKCKWIRKKAFARCYLLTNIHITNGTSLGDKALVSVSDICIDSQNQLKPALHAVLPDIDEDEYELIALASAHKDSSVVHIYMKDKHICLPRYMRPCDKVALFNEPDKLIDDEKYEFQIFSSISNAEIKQNLIFTAYRKKKSHMFESYLKRVAKSIAKRAIENHDENTLIELLHYDWLSGNALNQLLSDFPDNEMNVAKAYILEKNNNKNDSSKSFRL